MLRSIFRIWLGSTINGPYLIVSPFTPAQNISIMDLDGLEVALRVLAAINHNREPDPQDVKRLRQMVRDEAQTQPRDDPAREDTIGNGVDSGSQGQRRRH
jgi:hypothetical protein